MLWASHEPTANAAVFTEDFSSAPASRGWKAFGDASLFNWNAAQQQLEVTWDSSKSNSYFCHPLGDVLAKGDDFALQFDLRLFAIAGGVNPDKPSTFEIAVGLLRLASATNASFNRGTGRGSPNLVEWTYFPAADNIDATISPVMVSSNSQFIATFNFPVALATNDLYHVTMAYTASNQTLATTMTRNGAVMGPFQNTKLPASFADFRVDTVSISSYNDSGDPYGSILARGVVDNLSVTTPLPPVSNLAVLLSNGIERIQFNGRTNWSYTLEASPDLRNFSGIQTTNATPGMSVLFDVPMDPGSIPRFFRVRADKL